MSDTEFVYGWFGFIFVMSSVNIGKHISNILTFVYLDNHGDSVEGQILVNSELSIKITQYQMLTVFIPVILIAIFTGSWFAWGGVASLIMGLLKIQFH